MTLLFGHDKTVADWVGSKIGKPFCEPFTAIGVLDAHGTLIGGAVFNSYSGHSIELSLAGKGTITRGFWAGCAHYVFEQLKCVRLSIRTSNHKRNKKVRKMANTLGFTFEGVERRQFDGKHDAARYALTVDDLPAFKRRWRI